MRKRHCKIVATIGPASQSPFMLEKLHEAGVDIFRLNFSHGEHDTHGEVVASIREIEKKSGTPITIFADLQGPKIRCGSFASGGIDLTYGQVLHLVEQNSTDKEDQIPVPHPELLSVLEVDDLVRLDDGKLQLTIIGRDDTGVIARADVPGRLTDRKGINVPGRTLPISALTEKDRADLEFALRIGVDYVALSFVQRPEDIVEARKIIADKAGIIAKIEKPNAVDALEEIMALSDAIMVARGDLGVELPPENVPLIQRRIVRACRKVGKPVIVATHMLESMVDSPSPTRAEASDVSHAVMQGADAVMLSAESAVGRHPPTAVAIMDRIIKAAEADEEFWQGRPMRLDTREPSTADAISFAASRIADARDCQMVVAFTSSGSTAKRVSRDRPRSAIIAATQSQKVARKVLMYWGVSAVVQEGISDFNDMMTQAEVIARASGGADSGDRIVIVAGYPFGREGSTNTLKVSRLK
ncbi:MAG: pyruvate kinase [bacterium]